ncbi:MAG: hypothetical protein ACO1RX_09975 [Candidatus Sericytochromatia bacterium]
MSHPDPSPETPELAAIEASLLAALNDWAAGELTRAEAALLALLPQLPPAEPGPFWPVLTDFLREVAQQPAHDLSWSLAPALQARVALAAIWQAQGRVEEGLQLLQQVAEAHPSASLFHLYGRWQFEAGAYPIAALAWLQALIEDPSYLPASTDLATLANLNGDSELAVRLIQQALVFGQTPALFQELLLACAREPHLPMRTLFIELCVQHVTPTSQTLLVMLLQRLYDEGDYHHASYLGFHLLQVFPHDPSVRNHYVLAAVQQGQYAPALQALLEAPEALFRQGSHWFKLGAVCERWDMPLFADFAYRHAHTLDASLLNETTPRLARLQLDLSLDSRLAQILRLLTVAESFRAHLHQDPGGALQSWGLDPDPELIEVLTALPGMPQPA